MVKIEILLAVIAFTNICSLLWCVWRDYTQLKMADQTNRSDVEKLEQVMANWQKTFKEQQQILSTISDVVQRIAILENEKTEVNHE